ncbi:hypothetical protein [Apibacter adventoris]|uniref:hypothetical protein n=1 Tax=Apibacter adventoris TaxID=1679466 RepID=UPI0015E33B88|nr:hypothetical protein [Apibacter adventoris]
MFFSISGVIFSCQGQERKTTVNSKNNVIIETLNIKEFEKEALKYPITNTEYSYELKKNFENGSSYKITGSIYENGFVKYETPPLPNFYIIYKEFYANGNLKLKETYIGEHVKVGISQYYDEKGNLIKEVNEDKKFGKIKPQQVLEFLQEKGYINLKTGKGRVDEDGRAVFKLYFGEQNKEKYWIISIVKGIPNTDPKNFPEFGEPPAFIPLNYVMDGETGKVKIDGAKDKKTSGVYKTYEGKDYTREEWEEFEQKQFETYARKHNISIAKNDKKDTHGFTSRFI